MRARAGGDAAVAVKAKNNDDDELPSSSRNYELMQNWSGGKFSVRCMPRTRSTFHKGQTGKSICKAHEKSHALPPMKGTVVT